ncbi:MAG: hypothetical protein OXF98_01975 [Rhodospirillaceae bacterium]|nr:hypothetical protein [Rhodospirillaceae bacterium]
MSAGPYGIVPVQVVEDLHASASALRDVVPPEWRAEVCWDEDLDEDVLHVWEHNDGFEFPYLVARAGDWFVVDPANLVHWGVTWMPAASAPEHLAFFNRIAIELAAVDATEDGRIVDAELPPSNVVRMPPKGDDRA